jgi:hypothetical protein
MMLHGGLQVTPEKRPEWLGGAALWDAGSAASLLFRGGYQVCAVGRDHAAGKALSSSFRLYHRGPEDQDNSPRASLSLSLALPSTRGHTIFPQLLRAIMRRKGDRKKD